MKINWVWIKMPIGKQSIKVICADYHKNCQNFWRQTLAYYAGLKSLDAVLDEAGRFHCDSMLCDPHQRRIYKVCKSQFLNDLKKCYASISKCTDFQSLYDCVWKNCKKKGVGELAIYDTAMRIGAFLEIHKKALGQFKPRQVFLHNGALEGAKALLKRGALPHRLTLQAFAKWFNSFAEWEVEEILCIYKKNF